MMWHTLLGHGWQALQPSGLAAIPAVPTAVPQGHAWHPSWPLSAGSSSSVLGALKVLGPPSPAAVPCSTGS